MASEAFLGGMCCEGQCDPSTCVCGPDLCRRNEPVPEPVVQMPQELGEPPAEVLALARVERVRAIIRDMRNEKVRGRGWTGPEEPVTPADLTPEEYAAVVPVLLPGEPERAAKRAQRAAEADAAVVLAAERENKRERV